MPTTDLPRETYAYSFDLTTREYLREVRVYLNPDDGRYHLPINVVDIAPPSVGAREAARLNAKGDAWEVVPHFRGVMLWDTATGRPVANTLPLGEVPPAGVTAEPPPMFSDAEPVRNVWNPTTRAWQQEPDYSRFTVWWKAAGERAPTVPSGQVLPDTLTTLPPPAPGPHQAVQWNDAHATWALIADYRGVVYWTADGASHAIHQLGVTPPADYLTAPPIPREPPVATDPTTTEG